MWRPGAEKTDVDARAAGQEITTGNVAAGLLRPDRVASHQREKEDCRKPLHPRARPVSVRARRCSRARASGLDPVRPTASASRP